jgi:hypothetical protein
MRSPRILVAIIGLTLIASMTLTPSSASARDEARPAAGARKAAASQAVVAPIVITSKVVKKRLQPDRPRQLVFQGAVNPPKGPVYIQRATRCNRENRTCNFTFYRKVFLKKGRYQAVIGAPAGQRSWLWRAKVKSSYSESWQTCTKRPKQNCKVPF